MVGKPPIDRGWMLPPWSHDPPGKSKAIQESLPPVPVKAEKATKSEADESTTKQTSELEKAKPAEKRTESANPEKREKQSREAKKRPIQSEQKNRIQEQLDGLTPRQSDFYHYLEDHFPAGEFTMTDLAKTLRDHNFPLSDDLLKSLRSMNYLELQVSMVSGVPSKYILLK